MAPGTRSRPSRDDETVEPDTNDPVDAAEQAPQGSEPAQGGFLFITSTGQNSQQERKQLKTIRAHVMHNYLVRSHAERQDKEASEVTRETVAVQAPKKKPPVLGGQKMRFRLGSSGLEQRYPYRYRKGKKKSAQEGETQDDQAEPSRRRDRRPDQLHRQQQTVQDEPDAGFVPGMPVTWLGTRRVDEFGVLPVHINDRDQGMVVQFHYFERYPWCPINGQSSWPTFAMSDQLVFHATMFSWGMHFIHRRPILDPQEEMQIVQHKLSAIKLINERLSDPTRATSDETVAAVAAMTNIALVVDSYPEASKHMAGLHALVQMRGGLSTLASGVQQHLQRLISWDDLIYSEVFDEKLRFPPIEVWDESWGTLQRPNVTGSLPGLDLAELRAAGVPRHEVLEILDDIRELCYVEQVSPLSRTPEPGRMRRGDMFHRIERRLRVIVQADTAPGNNRWDATVWRAVSLAALLFTHHNLRGNPLKYRHFNVLSTQLYDTLLTMGEDLEELSFAPVLLIWILTTGASVTAMVPLNASFVMMLEKACVKYGLFDWEQFRSTVSGFLWTGQADEVRSQMLWGKIEALQQVRHGVEE